MRKEILHTITSLRLAFCGVLVMFLSIASIPDAQAQDCVLACSDNINFSIPGTGADCSVLVTPEMLMNRVSDGQNNSGSGSSAMNNCESNDLSLVLMYDDETPIPNSPYVDDSFVGQRLKYRITYTPTGNSCWGRMLIEDKQAPNISDCEPVEVHCFQDTRPTHEGGIVPTPTFTDCSEFDFSYNDQINDIDCGEYSVIINREWTVRDEHGYSRTCIQEIRVRRISLEDDPDDDISEPICPADIDLDCAATTFPNTDPSSTGYPYFIIDNERYDVIPGEDYFCELVVSYTDQTYELCGSGVEILRTWTIYDRCLTTQSTFDAFNCIQKIRIEDKTGPDLVCPDDFVVNSTTTECQGVLRLPILEVSDICSDNIQVRIITEDETYEGNGGQLITLPVGDNIVTYEATDECNNSSTCNIVITVEDTTPPIAVCDDHTAVSLTVDGRAIVYAETFDDGSFDNCEIDYFLVRRMQSNCQTGSEFGEFVTFECCEVGETVMVQFRVFDTSGNFNDCMVEVEIQDKLPPVITCPPDKIAYCTDDFTNLSIYGIAEGLDNCETIITEVPVFSLNSCGIGTITRTFTATDPGGLTATCVQVIDVQNEDPFSDDHILWPPDYTTDRCDTNTEPENLPSTPFNYNKPIFSNEGCDLLAVTHDDQILVQAEGSCFKIIRTWTIVDWCQYQPNSNSTAGLWTYDQVIKVIDNQLPVPNCPGDVTVPNLTDDCTAVAVTIPEFTATDCSPDLLYTYRIDYYNDGTDIRRFVGNNASGNYPQGHHTVTFVAEDGCGNINMCTINVNVVDRKAPTPVCINGLSADLMPMNGGGMVELTAEMFNKSSYDNCTAAEDLHMEINPSMFTCDHLGTNFVTLTVTDEAGNSASCQTMVVIQDNNGVCPRPEAAIIGGHIQNEAGDMVEDVRIEINGQNTEVLMTDETGAYQFDDLPMHHDYTLRPEKSSDIVNGVSTYDLVLMTKHVLGVKLLDSPYKMIAADVNRSGTVSTLDMILVRKVILGLNQEFPNNDSWRFIDATYEFPDPSQPFLEDLPEFRNYNNVENSDYTADFIAIKVGDVNGNAQTNSLTNTEERSNVEDWSLLVEDRWITKGDEVKVSVDAVEWKNVLGYQFTIDFAENVLDFINFAPTSQTNLTKSHCNFEHVTEGIITTSWNKTGNTLNTDNKNSIKLFSITFKAKESTLLSNVFDINSSKIPAQAYLAGNNNVEFLNVNLQYVEEQDNDTEEVLLYQNRPNPFQNGTQVSFFLPKPSIATLSVYDLAGKLLHTQTNSYVQGLNHVALTAKELKASGILYYRLETGGFTATRKMIVLE